MTEQQVRQLQYPFAANEIEWRLVTTTQDNTRGLAAAFVNSRAIQKRLDDVIGRENWQNRFTAVPGTGKEPTSYLCEIGIYYPERKEWIFKSDGAGSTDVEPVKGGLSNALKRAASVWGLGRYLYELQSIWVQIEVKGKSKQILESELKRLAATYNTMVREYLARQSSKSENGSPFQQASPSVAPSNRAQDKSTASPAPICALPTAALQTAPLSDAYRVIDLKVSRGGHGAQALVTLQKGTGESLTGYIRGETDLQRGQLLHNLKLTEREDPMVGRYNIINSYEKAA